MKVEKKPFYTPPKKRCIEDFASVSKSDLDRMLFISDFVSQEIKGYSFSLEGYNFSLSLRAFEKFKTKENLYEVIEHIKKELEKHPNLEELNVIRKAGIQTGLSFNEVSDNFGRPHLELTLKGLTYSEYSGLTEDQAQALLDNPKLTKEDVTNLTSFQIKAKHNFELSNDKVQNYWFKKEHLQALEAGRKYSEIEELNSNQALVMALKSTFSRKYVLSLNDAEIEIIIELEQERLKPNVTF
jgi:hypothetical protein